jgi:hypothetical protein
MTYNATVINVMIACPSDVATERQVIIDVIQEWNSINSEDRQIVLMPISWQTHSSPKMGERAQEVINKQVLEHCDLLVALFWTRLGSPTGNSRSGTVEEIEKHLDSGKPTMIYFSSAPVRLDSVDEKQYKILQEFRQECEQRGLIEKYESISEFRDKFTRQLAQTVIRYFSVEKESLTNFIQASEEKALPNLSDEAKQLLIEASLDSHGTILKIEAMDGVHISAHNTQFGEKGNARAEAKWKAAVNQLVNFNLIEDRGYKGEVFSMTDEGYRVADLLKMSLAK